MSQEITAALEYLKARGHDVGQGFMPPTGTKLHFWIDNRACSFEHISNVGVLAIVNSFYGLTSNRSR